MHAYLVVSQDSLKSEKFIQELSTPKNAEVIRLTLNKIEDVRNLNNFTKLKSVNPVVFVLESFHLASEEAQNALLKTLEEPQSSLQFIITTESLTNILPTIVSRCLVFNIKNYTLQVTSEYLNVLKTFKEGALSEKFEIATNLKTREEAIKFLGNLCLYLHQELHKNINIIKLLSRSATALSRIKSNANINLQLTNLIANS
ncbi:hypothetical protein A2961_04285 [Candidatus Woesebacteria bacterium RIFCSPLOWO2_01_FULL_39_21]|uniref:DNA polymerase III subunit delta n=1 Tax=Candidatus Woesebacteria bacterium RIFCSPLOWO2_01_FULL_39_21 TaxID=1802519 RepID=A0A1F8BK47_9BACT|nr:MAG: hypothetical protein A2W15_00240 [Candidatus Woesebacteria bacterium RBG_16_41_13]OGM23295.1 MAG: hypothetical protein A2691_01755 [Candidatus Woesebacteria bacterium RIFCSPHIGHO2_01_FULL_39_23]OGM64447.1 MAG: hypothetical protein A2961_04285 [Candidatus Woesebacteria bacterium RIFCSPLOWO2_01_FULL_39_21]